MLPVTLKSINSTEGGGGGDDSLICVLSSSNEEVTLQWVQGRIYFIFAAKKWGKDNFSKLIFCRGCFN